MTTIREGYESLIEAVATDEAPITTEQAFFAGALAALGICRKGGGFKLGDDLVAWAYETGYGRRTDETRKEA